jgi:integrase
MPTTCKTFETKADAEAWARHIENEVDRGVFVSRKEAENVTLSEALSRYIEECAPLRSHPEDVISKARRLQRRPIASRLMAAIRAKDIADFRKEREAEGVSGNTVRLDLALLSKLFNIARADWGMESISNPVQLVQKPKVAKGRERRFEADEEERLLKAAPSAFQPVIRFAVETCMRREEIASLDWKYVDLEQRKAFLPETKNETARTVPLSSVARQILRALPHREGSVFGSSEQMITRRMMDATVKAGIEDLHFHDLRHEGVSRLFEKTDLDVMEIKAITGHKSLEMLSRYTHLRTARLADRLDGAKRGEKKSAPGTAGPGKRRKAI